MDNSVNNTGSMGLRVGSMNCNGLGDKNKRKKVLTWLNKKNKRFYFSPGNMY